MRRHAPNAPNVTHDDHASVGHRVQHDVDADGVAVRREAVEELESSPSRSQASEMSVLCVITTMRLPWWSVTPRKSGTALSEPRSDVVPPLVRQNWIDGICGISFTSNCVLKIGWSSGMSWIGILRRRQHPRELRHPVAPRARAPVVVHPHEAALQQVRAQPLDLRLGERGGADVLHVQVRALKQGVVGEPHDDVVGRAVASPC